MRKYSYHKLLPTLFLDFELSKECNDYAIMFKNLFFPVNTIYIKKVLQF